jgi:hypothetical protein
MSAHHVNGMLCYNIALIFSSNPRLIPGARRGPRVAKEKEASQGLCVG